MKRTEKDFKILTPFTVKAMTNPPGGHAEMDESMKDSVIELEGCANFSGAIEEGQIFIDLVGDVVVPSGIDVNLWKKNPQVLLQHDRKCTIGKGLTVTKKNDGLYVKVQVHAGAMCAEDFYRIKSGLLCYFSVGFRTQAVEYKKVGDRQVCFITKCLLLEVSVVGIPANAESSFQVVKALPDGEGFYAGEFNVKEDFSAPAENEHQNHTPGEEEKGMILTLNDILPAEKVKELEALGVDLGKELTGKALVNALADAIKTAIKPGLKAEIVAELKAEQEAAEKAAAESAAEAEKAAQAAEAERLAAESAEAEKNVPEFSAEDTEAVKELLAQLATVKKELGIDAE